MSNYIFYIIISFLSFSVCISGDFYEENKKNEKLIFIYNASNTPLSVSLDFIHKIVSPSTYQCSLCKVTYGNVSMHSKWKKYIETSNYTFEFLYKNNYIKYHKDLKVEEFPVAYIYDGNKYELFISKQEFDLHSNLDSLIDIVNQKLNKD
jgi:hypothetical protein